VTQNCVFEFVQDLLSSFFSFFLGKVLSSDVMVVERRSGGRRRRKRRG